MFKWRYLQNLSVKCSGLYRACEAVMHVEDKTHTFLPALPDFMIAFRILLGKLLIGIISN